MALPTSTVNGATATINGIVYTYNSTKGAWYKQSTASTNVPVTISGSLSVSGNANVGNLGSPTVVNGNSNVTVTANSAVSIAANGAVRVTVDANGNVGIGTSSPKTKLQSTAATTLNAPSLGSATSAPFYVTNSDPAYGLLVGTTASDGHVWLQAQRTDGTATAYNITLNEAGGNVGIGTASPGYTLDVQATTGSISATSTTGTNYAKVQVNNTGGSYQFGIDNSAGTNFGSGVGYARVIWNDSASAPTILYTNSSERIRIKSDGNVGIGNAAPTHTLSVTGTVNVSGNANVGNLGTTGTANVGTLVSYTGASISGDFSSNYTSAPASQDAGRIFSISNRTYLAGASYGAADTRVIDFGIGPANVAYLRATGSNGFSLTVSSLSVSGNILPSANVTYNLGSATARWSTVYTGDLELSNGIGDYTIVEGEDDLFLYNNRSGKTYRFMLQEVDPSIVPPKKGT